MVKIVGDEVVTVTRFREGETESCSESLSVAAVCLRERGDLSRVSCVRLLWPSPSYSTFTGLDLTHTTLIANHFAKCPSMLRSSPVSTDYALLS